MAVLPYQVFTETAAVREDLETDITIISPEDSPFMARCAKVKAMQPYHEWLTDTLEARSSQTPAVEGAAFASAKRTPRVRLGNYCEIIDKSWTVSGTIQATDVETKGKGEFRYQRDLRRQELVNGMEYRTVAETATAAVSGASGTAREMKALLPWIATNVSSATANRTLTLDMANDVLQSCWDAGGRPRVIMCGGARKRNVINLNSSSYGTRQLPYSGGVIEQRADVFMGEFGGAQEVVLSRDIDANSYAVLEMARWKIAYLRRPHIQPMGKEGDRRSAQWVAEWTLVSSNEKASGKITQISG
jgi:hypothetical protein